MANSAFHLSEVGKWGPASAGKAKAGMVHSVSGWTRSVQVKLWNPLRTRAIPERLRYVFTKRRYTNPRLPLPLPYLPATSYPVRLHSELGVLVISGGYDVPQTRIFSHLQCIVVAAVQFVKLLLILIMVFGHFRPPDVSQEGLKFYPWTFVFFFFLFFINSLCSAAAQWMTIKCISEVLTLKFRTDFEHVTLDVPRTFKVTGLKVKITAWHNVSASKTL